MPPVLSAHQGSACRIGCLPGIAPASCLLTCVQLPQGVWHPQPWLPFTFFMVDTGYWLLEMLYRELHVEGDHAYAGLLLLLLLPLVSLPAICHLLTWAVR
jgi:hypothetical protein